MDQSIVLWIVVIVGMGGFMLWSQWRARKRYQEKIEQLKEGSRVVTIGGIHGTLTAIDREADRAQLAIAPNVEIEINLGAVGQSVGAAEEPEEPAGQEEQEALEEEETEG